MLGIFIIPAFFCVWFHTSIAQSTDLCCPPAGPSGKYLHLQQTTEPRILCDYCIGPILLQCPYDGMSGALIESISGCPSALRPDPFEPFCSITSPIHPRGQNSKCVDVGKNYDVGTQVQIDDCDGQNKQTFIYKQGVTTIRVAGTNLCLWAGPAPMSGSKVVLATCNEDDALQRWDFGGERHFDLDGTGFALHPQDGNLAVGTILEVATSRDQQWSSY